MYIVYCIPPREKLINWDRRVYKTQEEALKALNDRFRISNKIYKEIEEEGRIKYLVDGSNSQFILEKLSIPE